MDEDSPRAIGMPAMTRRAKPTPTRLPASPSTSTCTRYTAIICALLAPTHFRTAMLRIFCITKTRVTLDTAIPPRITMTKPTRLR